ncbi:phospholipase C [bacterium A37T11]|nr:phospholipase C [bacterium A37T11]
MNTTRREFLKKAALLSGAAGLTSVLPTAIQRAMAISADPGTTFYDAEHVVFLMQENRSFDHLFGTMRGVRGFHDPRAKQQPDGNKVWVQKDKEGHAIAPFHIDINKTKVTWQGGLPHGWPDQGNARNGGKYDQWIPQKTAMTMGHYDRHDVPFYYALADAFTLCDHNFCSSLTGTTPNRLFFWTGNIRPDLTGTSQAAVQNSMAESRDNAYVDWSTFPEQLEEHGVSWRIYQNELWTSNLADPTDYWLGNYGDNAIEYVTRHRVKLSAYFRKNGDKTVTPPLSAAEVLEKYNQLSPQEKNLIDKAFTTNIDEKDTYLELEPFTFTDDAGVQQTVQIPKNDIFKQFRADVDSGQLPTVSWLVAPQAFSDHTSTPFYGTWYVSEALNILTKNPEVWKKTIFILNYDENDGYFDHLPPFVVPDPRNPESGKVSPGIDISADFEWTSGNPIGLGYRVPLIVASPWSKGGYVNSQVFDHTSTQLFLEKFLYKKTGKKIHNPHISSWRRTICGDLTSVFRPYHGETYPLPDFLKRETVVTNIQLAKTKPKQLIPEPLNADEITKINAGFALTQEKGTRPACALPYQLQADSWVDHEKGQVILRLGSLDTGAPFHLYTPGNYKGEPGYTWHYAVSAGKYLEDQLSLSQFGQGSYDLCLHGPNGFFRQFRGSQNDPALRIKCQQENNGQLKFYLENHSGAACEVHITDNAYQNPEKVIHLNSGKKTETHIPLENSHGWYDFTVQVAGSAGFSQRFAGHIENGRESITDPYMGS